MVKNETLLHYYVVLGANKKNILLADPAPNVGVIKNVATNVLKKNGVGSHCYLPQILIILQLKKSDKAYGCYL